MIFEKLKDSPEKMVPVTMAFIVVGLSILMIGLGWPRFFPPVPHTGTDWSDFFRGVLFGIAIALEVTGVVLAATAAAAARKRSAL
jgi:MFS superfamily sulfate permease-like transporter